MIYSCLRSYNTAIYLAGFYYKKVNSKFFYIKKFFKINLFIFKTIFINIITKSLKINNYSALFIHKIKESRSITSYNQGNIS